MFISALVALPLYVQAQLFQNERLEIPILFDNESFDVAPVENQGLVLYRTAGSHLGGQFEVIHTDTSFREKWRGFLPVERNFNFIRQTIYRNNLCFLFYDPSLLDRNFLVYEITLDSGNYKRHIVRNSLPFKPTIFEVTSHGALVGGYFKQVPVVMFFEFSTRQSKILPGLFNEMGELSQVKINPDESFDLLVSAKNYQKQNTIWIKNYGPTGNLIRNIMLSPEDNVSLIFGRTIQTNNNTQIIAGVYGNRNKEFSRGLFVAQLDHEGVQKIHYYNFGELENFFKYMRVKREHRIKEKITRKKIKGRKLRFQYRFLVHELIQYNNQFILLGEAFYPVYKQVSRSYTPGAIMQPSQASSSVFDGYRYTHAVVLGIDANGGLLWDNSFEINDVKSFTLDQFVKMDTRQNMIALLYLYDNKIRTKIIQDSTVVEGKAFNELQAGKNVGIANAGEANINHLDYWYRDYFLAYGVQNLVSTTANNRKRKKVFFINKISYQVPGSL